MLRTCLVKLWSADEARVCVPEGMKVSPTIQNCTYTLKHSWLFLDDFEGILQGLQVTHPAHLSMFWLGSKCDIAFKHCLEFVNDAMGKISVKDTTMISGDKCFLVLNDATVNGVPNENPKALQFLLNSIANYTDLTVLFKYIAKAS